MCFEGLFDDFLKDSMDNFTVGLFRKGFFVWILSDKRFFRLFISLVGDFGQFSKLF